MTKTDQRALIVRPKSYERDNVVVPIRSGDGDLEAKQEEEPEAVMAGEQEATNELREWQGVVDNVEELNTRVARQFEDANGESGWGPPIVEPPLQPTRDEWFRHRTAHIPYAEWCKHCNVARAVRMNHLCAGERAKLVPDTDNSLDGPVKEKHGSFVLA